MCLSFTRGHKLPQTQPYGGSGWDLHYKGYECIPLDVLSHSQGHSLSWAINQSNASATATAIPLLCMPTSKVDVGKPSAVSGEPGTSEPECYNQRFEFEYIREVETHRRQIAQGLQTHLIQTWLW